MLKQTNKMSVLLITCGILLTSVTSSSAITRKTFDFIVGKDGDFKAARDAASKAGGKRFIMFFPNGDYNIGPLTGDSNEKTIFSSGNVSFIGQDNTKTLIYNTAKSEGLKVSPTLWIEGDNCYFQDLTAQNKAKVGTGRYTVFSEWGQYTIYKNVRQLSGQDTYYTSSKAKTYWEGGEIQGTVDFVCGGGDVFFNEVLLMSLRDGYIAAPADMPKWGYVFNKCTIDAVGNGYTYGRNWNGGRAVYINTIMKKVVSSQGWGPGISGRTNFILLGEYNSVKTDGSKISTSGRSSWSTILTDAQAAEHSIKNVLGDWNPQQYTKQVPAPKGSASGTTLKWNDDENALCWVVFKDNTYFKCVTETSCNIPSGDDAKKYSVRAANAMGGLGPLGSFDPTGVTIGSKIITSNTVSFSTTGNNTLLLKPGAPGKLTLTLFSLTGKKVLTQAFYTSNNIQVPLNQFKCGMYLIHAVVDGVATNGYINIL